MKKLILLLSLTLSFGSLNASHFAGGEIWYEYAGNAQHPHRYDVFLIVYRDVSGQAMCPFDCPADICVKSSCFPTINLTAPLLPFNLQPGSDTLAGSFPGSILTPELTDCVNPSSAGLVTTEAYRFYIQVDLPGPCSDIVFSFSGTARNGSDNLVAATGKTLYLEAKLNSTLGPNTSPKFLNPAAKSFCVGTPFIWSQAAIEPDGDSLYYDFGTPLQGNCGGTPTAIPFSPGYTRTQPMTTLNGISFNNRTGTLRFTAAQQEVVVINITITEYRYNPVVGWLVNGSSVRDLQVPVVTGCASSAQGGPQIAGVYPSQCIDPDSIKGYGIVKITNPDSTLNPASPGKYCINVPVISYNCFDSVVNIKFKDGVYCETIDGTEFRLIGPDSVARPVTGVVDNCRPDLVTKSIDLKLHRLLDVNGDYFLSIKKGTRDGNTITNKCGFPLNPFFLVIIRVTDCPILDYTLTNVSVNLDKEIDISWEIDTNSFAPGLFNSWDIRRANDNDQYHPIASLNDVNLRSFKDTNLEPIDVDLTRWQYRVQLVQNGTHFPPTNRIHSILLTDTLNADDNGHLYSWTEYDGWDSAAYEFQFGEFDTTNQQVDWVTYGGSDQNYFQDEYFFPKCEANRDTSGLYVFRVLATDVNNVGLTSESNWLYYSINCDEPPGKPVVTAVIPTVFTPNGDHQNDLFTIQTAYEDAAVSIYNRWGKPVFTATGAAEKIAWNGTDQSSGRLVADGVYYYIITLSGEFNDGKGGIEKQQEEKTGALTIFSSGTK